MSMKFPVENLRTYIHKDGYEWLKSEIYEVFYSGDNQKIREKYPLLNFRERLEFQFDEFLRELNLLSHSKDDYHKVLMLLSDALSVFWATIEAAEVDEKWDYYWYVGTKITNYMKAFYPDLQVEVNGYLYLESDAYMNIDIAFLRILGQLLRFSRIGNADDFDEDTTLDTLWMLTDAWHEMIGTFAERFWYNYVHSFVLQPSRQN